ncbi:MAG: hypothetical protein QGG42_17420 [Phycisphaerae bacterium]|jgi:hypothetical protein|nr:hypothetical protein [Phycisphaerae bacterium]
MLKTRTNILAAALIVNLLATFALADRTLIWNPAWGPKPKTGQSEKIKKLIIGTRPTPEVQRYLNHPEQYPNGPYGARIVSVTITRNQLNPSASRPLANLDAKLTPAATECRRLDDLILQYSRRMWSAAQYKHASRAHFEAYVNLAADLGDLRVQRNRAGATLRALQTERYNMARRFSSPRPTLLIWRVSNHLKRAYVPTHYLQDKARAYVNDHPELIGSTIRLYF